jgi:hypothetical protein
MTQAFGGTLSPIDFSNAWMRFQLNGVFSPGTIPHGGIKGFKRETGWDKKKGKGTKGATLTLTTAPPCEGTITVQLFTTQDFADWDNFVQTVLSIAPEKQKSEGLGIWHPAFQPIGLTNVVVQYFTPTEHVGKGLYTAEIALIEWEPPPALSVVSTVAATSIQPGDGLTIVPQEDPQITSLKAQIGQALAAAFPNGGQPPP